MIIYGAAIGSTAAQVRPFLRSLRGEAEYKGDLALFADGGAAEECRNWGWEPRPPGAQPFDRPHANRFVWFREDLRQRESDGGVLCLDTRDVVFQGPLDLPDDDRVYCPEEDLSQTVDTCPYNSKWLRVGYGEVTLQYMKGDPILCVGSFYGGDAAVLRALDRLCAELHRLQPRTPEYQDQAAWNFLARTHMFAALPVANEAAACYTVGYCPRESVSIADGRILRRDGTVPPIVHQWDRHQNLTALVEGLHGAV